jgi:RNA polymerase sigma-54 factor
MEIKQQLKLSQQLVMTPQLQQAIRLLQLSRLELIDEIRKELDANPVLADEEVDPRARANAEKNGEVILEPRAPDAPAMSAEKLDISDLGKRTEDKQVQEIDWEQFLENRTLQQPLPSNRGGYDDLPPIEQNLTKGISLVDHLRSQLQLSDFTDDERKFAESVIGNLDDNGFLDLRGIEREEEGQTTPELTIDELAREVPIDPEDAECVLREMQEWDPVGVCSRSLQ